MAEAEVVPPAARGWQAARWALVAAWAAIAAGAALDDDPGRQVVTELLGWTLRGWVGPAVFVAGLATLLLLLLGPAPRRATRWAWWWLMLLAAPVGVPAFLLLGGPGGRPAPAGRRLTGGWAFLLAAAIGLAIGYVRISRG